MGFIVYQMDVKSAFLYVTIDEEVYVMQPFGFQDPEFPDRVYKVEKAMYGLHQAPRAWYGTLSKYLLDNGFQRGTIDQTLFIRKHKGEFFLVQVYVDDIIFGSSNLQLCREFEALMHDKFQMSAMGKLTFFLGLHVLQKKDGIFFSQDKYVGDILKKFGYSNVRSMIRSLMYLTASRPDIMFAVCACARHQVTPKECNLYAVKRIFRYLKGHPKLGLWYPKESPFDLVVYSDSDYGSATQDRKSTTRGCQFLGRRLFLWQCKKQTIVATSTTEAEYVAAASGCGQVLWIQNQLLDYGFGQLLGSKQRIKKQRFSLRLMEQHSPQHDSLPPPPSHPTPTTEQIPQAPTEPLTHRKYTRRAIRFAQSKALSPTADEPASPSRDDRQGEAFPTISSLDAGHDKENIAKTSALPHESSLRVTSLDADEGSMQQRLHELMELCTSLQRQQSQMAAKIKDQDLEISRLKARVKSLEDKERRGAEPTQKDAPITRGIMKIWEELGADKSTELGSNDTEEMVNVLSSMEAANILTSGVAAASVSPAAGVSATGHMRSPIIGAKDKGKQKVVESEVPKKRKLQEQIDAQVAKEMEEEFARENQRVSEQLARDSEIARLHVEEELNIMIEGLDKSNKVIAKHLQEYKQAELYFSVGEKIELINELFKYQDHHAKILKYQAQQSKPLLKKEQREFYMKGLKIDQGSSKRMKTSEDVYEEELKGMMQLVPLEEVYVEALQRRSQLWTLVKETFSNRHATKDKEKESWVELKRLFEPDFEDQLWTHNQAFMHDPLDWKLYDTCGVHHVIIFLIMLHGGYFEYWKAGLVVVDAYDSDVDEAPHIATPFMANLMQTGPSTRQGTKIHGGEKLDFDVDFVIDDHDNTILYHQYQLNNEVESVPTDIFSVVPGGIYVITILDDLRSQLAGHIKANEEQSFANDSLKAELERYKTQVKNLEQNKVKKDLEQLVFERNKQNADLEEQLVSLKQQLLQHVESNKSLKTDSEKLKADKNALEESYPEELVWLINTNKVITELLQSYGQPVQTVLMLSKRPTFSTKDLHKFALGHRNLLAYDSEETLVQAEVRRTKMLERMKDLLCKVSSKLINYAKLNSMYDTFVPQKKLSREQVYWLPANEVASYNCNQSKPVTNFVRTRPAKSQVNTHLKMLKACFLEFDKVVKDRTTPSYITNGEWHFEHTKKCFVEEIIPFYEKLKTHVKGIEDNIFKEVSEYMKIFHELDKEYDQCVIDKKSLEIENKNLLIQNECFLAESVSKDIFLLCLLLILLIKNDSLRDENVSIKKRYQDLYQSKAESSSNVSSGAAVLEKPKVLAPSLYAMMSKYVPPQKRNNRKANTPLPRKETVSLVKKTNVCVNLSTGIKSVTKASKSKSKCETKTHRNLPARSENVKRVDNPLRNLNKRNHVDSSLSVKRCSRHMTDDRSKLINYMEKFIGTVRFGNDQFAAIVGHGNYKIGDTIITRVYYVEGLSHNLFSVGQFCDACLEVAFRKCTCYIRNKDKVDLLKGSYDPNVTLRSRSCKDENDPRVQQSGGYNVVPPPITKNFMPPKPDLVFNTAPIAVETAHSAFTVKLSSSEPTQDFSHTNRPSAPIIEEWVSDSEDDSETIASQIAHSSVQSTKQVTPPRHSVQPVEAHILADTPKLTNPKTSSSGKRKNRKTCFVCRSVDHLIKDCNYHAMKKAQPTPRNYVHRGTHKQNASFTRHHPQMHMVLAAVLTQSKPISTAVRPICAVVPKIMVTRSRHTHSIETKSKSTFRRYITRGQSPKISNSPPRVTAAQALVVSTAKGKKGKWVWRPKCPILDHDSRTTVEVNAASVYGYYC
nr:putative ribonuclease H-like domain-containing protein [Tanacetum cinerariifolium]